MSKSELPERASLEYLKKLAKDRLQELRRSDPESKLAAALLAVARDHGFPSWRALKSEVERRQTQGIAQFFDACQTGEVQKVKDFLDNNPGLVRAENPHVRYRGWTALHEAAKQGHDEVVQLLIQHGANPNAREEGDNTYPLHWAAACGRLAAVRVLLDAGADVQGFGDVHELDTIGWAAFYREPGADPARIDTPKMELIALLLERGARHHIFSAMCVGDLDLIRTLVEQNPGILDRRMSHFEQGMTALHFAISRKRYDILDLLIELGADLEAPDRSGATALSAAMLSGDREAIGRLRAAGAKEPARIDTSNFRGKMAQIAESTKKGVPMIQVPDIARALDWYVSIGFRELARNEDNGVVNFGMVSFGKAELMLNLDGKSGPHDVSLWFYTDQVDNLYQLLKSRKFEAAQADGHAPSQTEEIEFVEEINDTFYGAREFGIRDPNGYNLYFIKLLQE
jgi:ankyrin repeat protein